MFPICAKRIKKRKKKRKRDFFRSWPYDDNDDGDEHFFTRLLKHATRRTCGEHISTHIEKSFSSFFLFSLVLLLLLLKILNSVAYWSRKKNFLIGPHYKISLVTPIIFFSLSMHYRSFLSLSLFPDYNKSSSLFRSVVVGITLAKNLFPSRLLLSCVHSNEE